MKSHAAAIKQLEDYLTQRFVQLGPQKIEGRTDHTHDNFG